MRKTFGRPLSGLYPFLPAIVAELNAPLQYRERGGVVTHDKGTRAYLILSDPDPLSLETVECLVRTKMNQLRVREVVWSTLRFVEVATVPGIIGERCWRGTRDEMEELVERIKTEKIKRINDFSPDVSFE